MAGEGGLKDVDDVDLSIELDSWFKERGIDTFTLTTFPVAYRDKQRVVRLWIMLIRRQRNDPRGMPKSYKHVRELPEDHKVKEEVVLKETGLKDEDLPWKTIIDPFGHHR